MDKVHPEKLRCLHQNHSCMTVNTSHYLVVRMRLWKFDNLPTGKHSAKCCYKPEWESLHTFFHSTTGPAQKTPALSQHTELPLAAGELSSVSSLSQTVVKTGTCCLSRISSVAVWVLSGKQLSSHFLSSFRHLSSCGILMTRTPRVVCLHEWDTMTAVPQSRNFISLTNKRKEYSERRILG